MDNKYRIVLLYILICIIWGSTWIAIKISLVDMTPLLSSGIRFVIAGGMLFAIIKIKKFPLNLNKPAVKLYMTMSLFSFVFPFALVYWGEVHVPSGLASVLFAIYPFCIAIISYFFLKNENIGLLKILGIISGFTGIVILFYDSIAGESNFNLLGMGAIILSALLQAIMAVAIKKWGKELHPVSMNFIPMLAAGFLLLISAYFLEDLSKARLTENSLLAILFLAFFGSVVSFSAYYWLLKRISIVLLSLVTFITPIIALLIGWVFGNEILTTNHLIGSGVILGGLLISAFDSARG